MLKRSTQRFGSPPAPFVPLRGTAGTFGGGQDGSGGTGETLSHNRAISGKTRRGRERRRDIIPEGEAPLA